MEVEVNPATAALSNGEDRVKVPYRVTVETRRVNTAYQVSARTDRSLEQLCSAGSDQETALWKRHDLYIDSIGALGGRLDHTLDS